MIFLTISLCLVATLIDGAAIITAPQRCPLQNGNLLDVDLFVADDMACKMKCEKHENDSLSSIKPNCGPDNPSRSLNVC